MAREIPLTKGKVAIVDDGDYELVSAYRWCATLNDGRWYAVAHVPGSGASGRGGRNVYLHHVIMGRRAGEQIDHKDHDGLNNQRSNLRRVTQFQNMQNRKGPNSNSGTGYRNVYKTRCGTFNVKLMINRKSINIGSYATVEEAALAATDARRRYMTHTPERG